MHLVRQTKTLILIFALDACTLSIFSSADGTYEMQMKTKAEVRYDGTVKWRPPTTFKSSCDIEVKFFPFDEQICRLTFGSWTYNIEEVLLTKESSLNLYRKTIQETLMNQLARLFASIFKFTTFRSISYTQMTQK